MSENLYTHLQCSFCGKLYDKNKVNNFCLEDNQPLEACYNFNSTYTKENLNDRPLTMWRYHEMLPLSKLKNRISLNEGLTPMHRLTKLEKKLNQDKLFLKDESGNPTGSFKARGISVAVSKAKELGIKEICIPTAGNAGSALSAYCAKAEIKAHVFMPDNTPRTFQLDCEIMGANVTKVKGTIADAAALMYLKNDGSWFDISTLKEPFRLEGKKTLGYEIAEQLNWKLPDVIIYPTGGGTGLIGIWKAFYEMKAMGWIDAIPTKMVVVQSMGCDPVVKAFEKNKKHVLPFDRPLTTIANGLLVPNPFGDKLIMKTLYQSNGVAISVSEKEIKESMHEFAKNEGLFLSPEGAAVWAGYNKLKLKKWIQKKDSVVLLNTGSIYKYTENL